MSRIFSQKAKESRERLFKAAVKEFSINGFQNTKVSDIVFRAGFTQRVFYIYFDSKKSIHDEIVAEWKSRATTLWLGNKISSKQLSQENFFTIINKRWDTFLCFLAEDPEFTKAAYFYSPSFEETRRYFLEELIKNMQLEQKYKYIRSNMSIEILAESVLSTFEGVALRYVLPGKIDPSDAAYQLTELYIYGTKPRENKS